MVTTRRDHDTAAGPRPRARPPPTRRRPPGAGDHRLARRRRRRHDRARRAADAAHRPAAGDPAKRRRPAPALVVKIDNTSERPPADRPQPAADIVYEELVNDSLTRFAVVFHSQGSRPGRPDPLRSHPGHRPARVVDGPLFLWSGGNADVTIAISDSDLVDLARPRQRAGGLFRERGPSSRQHNLFGEHQRVLDAGPARRSRRRRPHRSLTATTARGRPASAGRRPRRPARHRSQVHVDVERRERRGPRWRWRHAHTSTLPRRADHHRQRRGARDAVQPPGDLRQPGGPERRRRRRPTCCTGGNLVAGTWLRADQLRLVHASSTPTARRSSSPRASTFIELPGPATRCRSERPRPRHVAASARVALRRRAARRRRGLRQRRFRRLLVTPRPAVATTKAADDHHDARRRPPPQHDHDDDHHARPQRRPPRRRPRPLPRPNPPMPLTGRARWPSARWRRFGRRWPSRSTTSTAPTVPQFGFNLADIVFEEIVEGRPHPLRRHVPLAVAEPGRARSAAGVHRTST